MTSATPPDRDRTGQGSVAAGVAGPADHSYQVHRVARLLRRRLEAELAPLDLTGPQAAVLLALAGAPGPLAPAPLAERLGMDRPTLSGVLTRLERGGWLAAEANPRDGRSRLLRLTRRADAALPQVRAASARVTTRALSGLDAAEVGLLLARLEGVALTLEEADVGKETGL